MRTREEMELEEVSHEIERFIALRELHLAASALEAERQRVLESIGKLSLRHFETDEDIGIVVHPKDAEGHLTAEYMAHREWGATAGQLYHPTSRGGITFDENVTMGSHSEMFVGRSIDYDVHSGSVWVYNDSRTFRVQVDDSVVIEPWLIEGGGD